MAIGPKGGDNGWLLSTLQHWVIRPVQSASLILTSLQPLLLLLKCLRLFKYTLPRPKLCHFNRYYCSSQEKSVFCCAWGNRCGGGTQSVGDFCSNLYMSLAVPTFWTLIPILDGCGHVHRVWFLRDKIKKFWIHRHRDKGHTLLSQNFDTILYSLSNINSTECA